MENKNFNPSELNDELLEQVAGGAGPYIYCCPDCKTPLKLSRNDNYQMVGYCPTCNCYPSTWLALSK